MIKITHTNPRRTKIARLFRGGEGYRTTGFLHAINNFDVS